MWTNHKYWEHLTSHFVNKTTNTVLIWLYPLWTIHRYWEHLISHFVNKITSGSFSRGDFYNFVKNIVARTKTWYDVEKCQQIWRMPYKLYTLCTLPRPSKVQGCTTCTSLAAWLWENWEKIRKWRENGEKMRRWRGKGQIMRKLREIYFQYILIFSLFPPSLSISRSKIVSFCPKMLNMALLSRISQKKICAMIK